MEGKDIERSAADGATVENLRRLANILSTGTPVELRLNGRRVHLPEDGNFRVALDRDPRTGSVEVDVRWANGEPPPRMPRAADGAPGPHIRLKALIAEPRV